jgi:hypothetical protein
MSINHVQMRKMLVGCFGCAPGTLGDGSFKNVEDNLSRRSNSSADNKCNFLATSVVDHVPAFASWNAY